MRPGLIAPLLAVVALALACSDGDGSDETEPEIPTSTTASTATTTTLVPPPPTDPPEVPVPVIGDLEVPCGTVDEVDLPAGAGIDVESITIGTGNDRGGLATFNAGRGISEAVTALADHCNGFGGLAGRDILVVDYDAAGIETAERVAEACGQVFAMVGHRYLDALTAASVAAQCSLPMLPAAMGTLDPFPLHSHFAALFIAPAEASQVVLVGPDTVSAAFERGRRAAALTQPESPFTMRGTVVYPIDREPDWVELVGGARATGAGVVHIDGGCDHAVIPFLDVASAAGWDPVVIATTSAYDDACLARPDLIERVLLELPLLPFEDGEAAPATERHGEIFDAIGAPRTGDALLAASSFWRWVVTTADCGDQADRECLVGAAADLDEWTGGGLHPVVRADGSTEPCAVVMGVREGRWVRLLPADPGAYECNPDWSVEGV